jgi:hypothetical protein
LSHNWRKTLYFMKKSIIITSVVLVAAAGMFFVFALFATPVQAGILDGNFDCLPLPVCPDSDVLDCFPLPFCPNRDNDHYGNAIVVNCNKNPNRCAQTPRVGRSTYAEPATQYTPIQVSCYASPGTVRTGESVTWTAQASGGYGSYTYNWRDSDGATGSSPSFTRSYGTPSFRSAQVTVHSGSMQVTRDCGSVNVYEVNTPSPQQPNNPSSGNNNNTNKNNNSNRNTNNIYINGIPAAAYQSQYQYPVYEQPNYYYPQYQYQQPYQYYTATPLSVSCGADTTYTTIGNQVIWRAFVTGGYGNETYAWNGTDNLYGYARTLAKTYGYPGQKSATVTVTSGGQVASAYCPPITVGGPVYQPPYQAPLTPAYPPAQPPALDIACYASPSKIKVGQASTWTADARGGVAPYRYSWTGTDGLVSNQRAVTKTYYTAGTKKAILTITSADGRTATRNCGATVSVTSAAASVSKGAGKEGSSSGVAQAPLQTPPPTYQGPQYYDPMTGQPLPPGVQPFPNYQQPDDSQAANSFFSMKNVPWGWVAFLVILVLFVTVLYLIFNKSKI